MERYVILEHDYPERHWDLMLECGAALRTWRLLVRPDPGRTVPAQASFDHRLAYLDYEGPVSGGRGCVQRWDQGSFQWLTPEAGREAERVAVLLQGERLHGLAVLEQTAAGWTFTAP